MQANNLRRGMAVIYEKQLYLVIDFEHRTPGNKRAFVQLSIKNISMNKIIQVRFSATEEMKK